MIAHEAGHFFGDFHTDNADDDAEPDGLGGANFGVLFGVGPDGIGGTADDVDVDFGETPSARPRASSARRTRWAGSSSASPADRSSI